VKWYKKAIYWRSRSADSTGKVRNCEQGRCWSKCDLLNNDQKTVELQL